MSGSSSLDPLAASVRSSQIIVAAMTAGSGFFLVIALVVAGGQGSPPDVPVLTYVACAIAAAQVAARAVVPGIVVAQLRRRILDGTWGVAAGGRAVPGVSPEPTGDVAKLTQVLLTRNIISAALLEGAIFLLLVAYLVERSPVSLGFAVVLMVALAAHIPTFSRSASWIEEQRRLLDEERSL